MKDGRMLLSNFNLLAMAPGGVARLRELILTLAVQGKLVPQDPGDEPASVLLKKILAEKDRLMAEGKIKRDKPLAEIADEERPFWLPAGWEWVRLQEAYDVRDGTHDSPKFHASGFPLVTSKNIYSGCLDLSDVKRISPEDHANFSKRSKVVRGDILFAMIGSIGNPVIVNTDTEFSIKNVALLKQYSSVLSSPDFLLLNLKISAKKMKAQAAGGVQSFVSLGQIRNTVIGLPPLAEQFRIAARVEELMRVCDALEAKGKLEAAQHTQLVSTFLGTLTGSDTPEALAENWQRIATHFDLLLDRPQAVDALEQTVLQLAVRGLLVPQDPSDEPASVLLQKIRTKKDRLILEGKIKRDKPLPPIAEEEKPFEAPAGWEWVPIEMLAIVGTGTTPSRDNTAYWVGGEIPWVTSGETGQLFIAKAAQYVTDLALSQTNLTVYPVGTLIVAMYGQGKTRGQVSELCVEASTNQACAAIVLIESSVVHRSFVKFVFEKSYDEIRELAAGGAQPNLNVGKIKSTLIPLPPLSEQSRIVARVQELRRLCAELRQRLSASQTTQAHLAEALVESVVG